MASKAQGYPICYGFVLKYEKSLKGRAVYRNGGRVWVTAKETVIVKGSSWREKMMSHIVVSSYSESTCCSINCDLTTTDYIKLLLHQTERWGFYCRTKRKETNSKNLTWFDKIRPAPPVHEFMFMSRSVKHQNLLHSFESEQKTFIWKNKNHLLRVHIKLLGIKTWECYLKNSWFLCQQTKINHFFVFFPLIHIYIKHCWQKIETKL